MAAMMVNDYRGALLKLMGVKIIAVIFTTFSPRI